MSGYYAIEPEKLENELREALTEAARLGMGEAIKIVIEHQKSAIYPDDYGPLIERLQQHSAAFAFSGERGE